MGESYGARSPGSGSQDLEQEPGTGVSGPGAWDRGLRNPGTRSPGPGSQDLDLSSGCPMGESYGARSPGPGSQDFEQEPGTGVSGPGARDRGLRNLGTRSPGPGSQDLDSSSGCPMGELGRLHQSAIKDAFSIWIWRERRPHAARDVRHQHAWARNPHHHNRHHHHHQHSQASPSP